MSAQRRIPPMATPEREPGREPGADQGFDLEQGLFSHLLELRSRLLKAIACVVVVLACLVPFANRLYTWLAEPLVERLPLDRKSTRLNSSHPSISYAVFCLKKKKQTNP